jgi:hypothetical protein
LEEILAFDVLTGWLVQSLACSWLTLANGGGRNQSVHLMARKLWCGGRPEILKVVAAEQ